MVVAQQRGRKQKIIVALSGGVDSAVAAQLLKEEGHEVIGVYLELWPGDYYRSGGQEAKKEPWSDAQAVCRQLGIPFYALNCAQEFKRRVVNYFLATYASGATPNPCVVCNKQVKFRRLIRYANQIGFDAVASGHYARLIKDSGRYELWRAKDKAKDQSYFLCQLNQDQLSKSLFPIGNLTKPEVREIAREMGLLVVVVHHSGKDADRGMRGWSGFLANADGVIALRAKRSGWSNCRRSTSRHVWPAHCRGLSRGRARVRCTRGCSRGMGSMRVCSRLRIGTWSIARWPGLG